MSRMGSGWSYRAFKCVRTGFRQASFRAPHWLELVAPVIGVQTVIDAVCDFPVIVPRAAHVLVEISVRVSRCQGQCQGQVQCASHHQSVYTATKPKANVQ